MLSFLCNKGNKEEKAWERGCLFFFVFSTNCDITKIYSNIRGEIPLYILFKDCQYGLVFVFLSEHNILCRWKNYLQQKVIINLLKIKSRLVYAGRWEKQRTKKAKLLNRIKNCGIIWTRPVMGGLPYAESEMSLIILRTNLASQLNKTGALLE